MVNQAQESVNKLSKLLRLQVIEYLLKKDCLDYNQPIPSEEELTYRKRAINNMPCCTKMLKRLFQDAHEMHEEKGMFPHTACVGDLEWCLKNRNIGYRCCQNVKHSWLVAKEDIDLRQLPAFKQIAKIYTPMIQNRQAILAPTEQDRISKEALELINTVAEKTRMA